MTATSQEGTEETAERRENTGAAPSYLSPEHTARLKLFWAGVKE